jgi:hypothetical protein
MFFKSIKMPKKNISKEIVELSIMTKCITLLFVVSTFLSCSKGGSTPNPTSVTVPTGTNVKLEAFTATGTQIAVVQYSDAQQNSISKYNVSNNWTYTYKTTKDNQYIFLQINGGTDVTGRIYINGVLKKEATGALLSIVYP